MKKLQRATFCATLCAVLLGLGACKQGRGERCQVADDCEDGLVCAPATMTCQGSLGGGLDAAIPIDAPLDAAVDAPLDAPLDAPPDAPPDAL